MQQILCKSLLAGRAIGILARNLGSGTVSTSQGPASALPLISQFQSRWPKPIDEQLPKQMEPLPRTIPDSKLHFQMKATFAHGSSIFYPHLKFHPSDFKVSLVAKISDLGFNSDLDRQIFIEMVGPRYNPGRLEVRLTCDKFPNRLENRKYVIYLLEKLVAESKHLATVDQQSAK